MAKALARTEVADCARQLRALLARVEAGDVSANPAMVHRIEGACIALEAVADPAADPAAALRDAFPS